MDMFAYALVITTLLYSLVTGILMAFALVVMPGIGRLTDGHFIRAFQSIDGVIQDGQPVFGLVWLGSAVGAIVCGIVGAGHTDGLLGAVTVCASALYLLGVQLPTFRVNVPLNNWLQTLDTEDMDSGSLKEARVRFEGRWNRWNTIRTVVAGVASVQMLWVLLES